MIVEVNKENILSAAEIHSKSWQDSHLSFCDEQFVHKHTVENQTKYLQSEIDSGKRLYMLTKTIPVGTTIPVGIVSIKDNLIENLYVLPSEQHKGYGAELLIFAINKCTDTPILWILDNNKKAYGLYTKYGFELTGNKHKLSDTISEIEMKLMSFKE